MLRTIKGSDATANITWCEALSSDPQCQGAVRAKFQVLTKRMRFELPLSFPGILYFMIRAHTFDVFLDAIKLQNYEVKCESCK